MQRKPASTAFAGRDAPERKYDLLTALGAWGMGQGAADQILCLRFMTLLTARYNWRRDELNSGQREIAALWSVDPRTVKRQMSRLRELGWLVLIEQGARGRVARYRLDAGAVFARTAESFANVGPDFVARLGGADIAAQIVPEEPGNIVRFPGGLDVAQADPRWGRIAERLRANNPHSWASWLAPLEVRIEGDVLHLRAPSAFHARHVATHLRAAVLNVALLDGIARVVVDGME